LTGSASVIQPGSHLEVGDEFVWPNKFLAANEPVG
jgi:hypothetical protein